MTAIQMGALNAEILRNLGTISEDESVLIRVAKYLRKVVKEMREDPTLMTKEEFFARVDEARKGPSYRLNEGESLDDFIRRYVESPHHEEVTSALSVPR